MTQQLTLSRNQLIPANITETQLDYIMVDGSGSMMDQWWDTIDALDAYRDTLIADPVCAKGYGVCTVFSSGDDMDMIQRNGPIAAWPRLGDAKEPLGSVFHGTALYDAINLACRNTAKLVGDLDATKRVALTIATDGEERDSQYTDLTQAKALLNWAKAQGWQVTLIGCNWNSKRLADLLGLQPAQSIGVAKAHLSEAAKALAAKRTQFARNGAPMHWSEDEQQQFGGYLTAK